ncbi:MAG TPA: ABC transporter ATP-binding protein [Dongiaceae bacterium]|nr:ABC transporter ATP-binding protein [Dongiaceae bacterium]
MQAPNPKGTLLRIRNLRIEAGAGSAWKEIVHGVSLDLAAGEMLGLIGESGAGKSTIGLAAMGFARPGCRISGGEVVFNDIDLLKDVKELKRVQGTRVAYVAQSAAAAFNPAYRLIRQCIEVPVVRQRERKSKVVERVRNLFTRMHLPNPNGIGDRFPHQVSGGQLQRVMASMAMSPRPALIVFDEPTTALDVTTQVEVLAAVRETIRDLGMAGIYISHDLAVVAQMADRIMVLKNGNVVEEGSTDQVLQQPREAYTRNLVGQRRFRKQHVPDAQSAVLTVDRVSAGYHGVPVLENVSIEARTGETVAVVGESGSGKSTLARVVAGLLKPMEGRVLLDGTPLLPSFKQRPREELRAIQMIHQMPDTALNPQQIVGKIIGRPLAFYFGLTGARREERVRELLRMVEMDPDIFLKRRPGELSGGQKQRLCIARALAADPKIIICDEVTSALDPLIADEILKLLDRLQHEKQLTYIFITHDLATVSAIADKVVVMKAGRIVEQGSKEEIFAPPHDPYTELLLSSTPKMETDWLDNLLDERDAARKSRSGEVAPAEA